MKRWQTTALALATTCMIGVPAMAQSSSSTNADARQETSSTSYQQQSQNRSTQRSSQSQIEGEIASMQSVRDNQGNRHMLARIETQDGPDRIVSLGSLDDFREQDIRLSVGQDVTVQGSMGRIQGNRIFVANELETNNRTYSLGQDVVSTQDSVGDRSTLPRRDRGSDIDSRSAFDRQRKHFNNTQRDVEIDPVDLDNIVRDQRYYDQAAEDNRYTNPDRANRANTDQRRTSQNQQNASRTQRQGSQSSNWNRGTESYDSNRRNVQALDQRDMSQQQRRQNIIDRAQSNRNSDNNLRNLQHIDADDRANQNRQESGSQNRGVAAYSTNSDDLQPLNQSNMSQSERRQQILQHAQRVRSGDVELRNVENRDMDDQQANSRSYSSQQSGDQYSSDQPNRQRILQRAQRVRSGEADLRNLDHRDMDDRQASSQSTNSRQSSDRFSNQQDRQNDYRQGAYSRNESSSNRGSNLTGDSYSQNNYNRNQWSNDDDRQSASRNNQSWQSDDNQRASRNNRSWQSDDNDRTQANSGNNRSQWQNQARGSIERESDLRLLAFDNDRQLQRVERLSNSQATSVEDLRQADGEILVQGDVQSVRQVQFRGSGETHMLATVQTKQGNNITVDLGSEADTRNLQLNSGDSITAVGEVGRISGQPALFATEVARTISINRSFD